MSERGRTIKVLMSEVGPLGGRHARAISTDIEGAVLPHFLESVVELGEDVSLAARHDSKIALDSCSSQRAPVSLPRLMPPLVVYPCRFIRASANSTHRAGAVGGFRRDPAMARRPADEY